MVREEAVFDFRVRHLDIQIPKVFICFNGKKPSCPVIGGDKCSLKKEGKSKRLIVVRDLKKGVIGPVPEGRIPLTRIKSH